MVAPELKKVRAAADKAAFALMARNTAICHASAEGHSIRKIAEHAGLSSARVHQILRGK